MNVAIDVSPIQGPQTGHKVRGVGFYITRLKYSFEKYCKDATFKEFVHIKNIPEETDLVHFPYFEPFFLSLPNVSKKTVVTVHDLTPIIFSKHFPAGIKGNLRWRIQKSRLKHVDAIITDSESSKKDIVRLTGISSSKVHVVYLAAGEEFTHVSLSPKEETAFYQKYHLPEKFGLYVGDVTWNKNLPRLVEAIKQANIPFVFVGKMLKEEHYDTTNPWNADLVTVQEGIAQNENIHSLGFVPTDDLVKLYTFATFFIMPSLYEGFGLPVIEAMQCGTPVITTKEGSLPEVAGEGAYFVDPYSVMDIAKGMQEVYSDESLQHTLREKGYKQAENFSWKKTAEETNNVYKKVASIS